MLRKLLADNTTHFGIQFFRYGIVAVIAFVVDFGLLLVFTYSLHIYYLLSSILSFTISLVANYYLSTLWVFSHSKRKRVVEVSMFLIINIVALLLNTLIIWSLTSGLGLYYLYSKLVAVTIVFFWSFGARRYFIFSHKLVGE